MIAISFLRIICVIVIVGSLLSFHILGAASSKKRYFGHDVVEDRYGVIAPWYTGQNGQFDFRVRVAAETMKRYPWTSIEHAVAIAPEYVFNGTWRIDPGGEITIPPIDDWTNGDLGQMAARVIFAWIEYYRYSGDPAAIAHINVVADTILNHCLTDSNHPWPNFLISVPVKGKPYGKCNPAGWIQLDILAEFSVALLRAYQLTGNTRWLDTVKNWAEVLAQKRNREPGAAPWGRYANPQDVRWGTSKSGNNLTGGVVYLLTMFDELIRLGYRGTNNSFIEARDAGRAYLRDVLLPAWTVNDTWGRNYWDWEQPVQGQTTTDWVVRYLMANKDYFTNWKNDVRNILSLFLNHTSVDPKSRGDVYSGAWAFPESSSCCGSSLAWGPMELALDFAQYGVEADSEWAKELARRQQILATYDAHETGVAEDNIDGGFIAAGGWFKATHPSALKWILRTMGWLPEIMGANRENHIMRSSAVVNRVVYGDGKITYSTFDAPENTVEVLRLAFKPRSVTACGGPLKLRSNLDANGYTVKELRGGDYIVSIRHDGCKNIAVEGDDPQVAVDDTKLIYSGVWTTSSHDDDFGGRVHTTAEAGAAMTFSFTGNQVRLVGRVNTDGGLADVYIDGVKQLAGIDFWNPEEMHQQVVYYKNGLSNQEHTLKIVARGTKNPLSRGNRVYVDAIQYSAATGDSGFGEGGGPTDTQRMIFGYTGRTDYIDTNGNAWRPGTEFVVRTGKLTDSVAKTWWTMQQAVFIAGTADQELYRYGVHWPDFTVYVTVGPGTYYVRLKFAETQYLAANQRAITIYINDEKVTERMDVFATAGGANKAVDLVYNNINPKNGVIKVRFTGDVIDGCMREAMVQAIEVGPGYGGTGAAPKSVAR